MDPGIVTFILLICTELKVSWQFLTVFILQKQIQSLNKMCSNLLEKISKEERESESGGMSLRWKWDMGSKQQIWESRGKNWYIGEPEVWETQLSSTNENIPEDVRLAVLEPSNLRAPSSNLRKEPMGAMCLPCLTYALQPFDISAFEEVISIYQENFPINFN